MTRKIELALPFGEIEIKAKISERVGKGIVAVVNKLISPFLDLIPKFLLSNFCNAKVVK